MKFFPRSLLAFLAAASFANVLCADSFKYDWVGGAIGYSGYIILDAPSSSGGSVNDILAGQFTTPQGTFNFNPATIYASRPLFTWDSTEITYMFFAWIANAPYVAIGANYDYNFNGLKHTYIVSVTGSGTQYIDESGRWLAESSGSSTVPESGQTAAFLMGSLAGILFVSRKYLGSPNEMKGGFIPSAL